MNQLIPKHTMPELEELLLEDLKKAIAKGHYVEPGAYLYGVIINQDQRIVPEWAGKTKPCGVCAIGAYLLMEHEGEKAHNQYDTYSHAGKALGLTFAEIDMIAEGFECTGEASLALLTEGSDARECEYADLGYRVARRIEEHLNSVRP